MTDSVTSPKYSDRSARSMLPNAEARIRRRRWRQLKDKFSHWGISAAGYSVVFSLALIFVYLFYEVAPILRGATLTPQTSYSMPGLNPGAAVSHLVLERYETLGINYADDGQVTFFEVDAGQTRAQFQMDFPDASRATSFAAAEAASGVVAYGLDNGQAVVTQHEYTLTFPNDQRYIDPALTAPFGVEPITLDPTGQSIEKLALQIGTRGTPGAVLAGLTNDGRLVATLLSTRENILTGEVTVQATSTTLPAISATATALLVDKDLRSLFVADDQGYLHYYDINNFQQPRLVESVKATTGDASISAMAFLVGTVSLVVGTDNGDLSQWFLVRDSDNQYKLEQIRSFKKHPGAITQITPEYSRKGFIAADATGAVGTHYGTSARTLLLKNLYDSKVDHLAVSPINGRILALTGSNQLHVASLWNQHPQISFSALWNRVWYEGRANPEYIWQSSSASDEFESKFSLIPLSVGTLKAAFFAMMFAMPLGLLGAIYTAYFMTPKLRGVIKPTIEIMEALPTVILGFLAGLWLAPFMENNLPAVFSILILMPAAMLLVAALWKFLPRFIRDRIPSGWEALILMPIIALIGWVCVAYSPWIEILFFDGSMRQWFTEQGITYDQRNAMVVGVAMGFAVIPTIYTIAEDAIFNVPKHLTQGSLALGATPWQTVIGVVLPTASPGMFSALMIGSGRAIGETMIVLMATGNSPIVNFNIFEGMRTLSANIAVELPETAVGSSHFRVLFLAALVLLVLTFILNTVAEVVRQRLRQRYSNL